MPQPGPSGSPPGSPRFGPIRAGPVLLVSGLVLLAWLIAPVLLLVFAGVVIAVGLDGLTAPLAARLPIRRGWVLLLVCLVVFGLLIGATIGILSQLAAQVGQLWDILIDAIESGLSLLASYGWAQELMQQFSLDGQQVAGFAGDLLMHVASYGMSAVGAVASVVILLTIALFLVASPQLYRGGLLKLVPPARRPEIDGALSAVAYALRWWFLSQLASMAVLGTTVGLGLWIIGVELWLSLAVITAILTFIPYLGPIIAGIPIIIVGFTEDLQTGLIVAAFYIIVQNVEGSVITPLIQQKAVKVPPALAIAVQVLMALAFGLIGIVLAAPITVVGMVLVQKLYVEGVLEEEVG